MSNNGPWRPRISILTTEERYHQLQKHIPWGMKEKLFNAFGDELIRLSQEHGPVALGILLKKGFKIVLEEDQ